MLHFSGLHLKVYHFTGAAAASGNMPCYEACLVCKHRTTAGRYTTVYSLHVTRNLIYRVSQTNLRKIKCHKLELLCIMIKTNIAKRPNLQGYPIRKIGFICNTFVTIIIINNSNKKTKMSSFLILFSYLKLYELWSCYFKKTTSNNPLVSNR
jgi:hypothetical protein